MPQPKKNPRSAPARGPKMDMDPGPHYHVCGSETPSRHQYWPRATTGSPFLRACWTAGDTVRALLVNWRWSKLRDSRTTEPRDSRDMALCKRLWNSTLRLEDSVSPNQFSLIIFIKTKVTIRKEFKKRIPVVIIFLEGSYFQLYSKLGYVGRNTLVVQSNLFLYFNLAKSLEFYKQKKDWGVMPGHKLGDACEEHVWATCLSLGLLLGLLGFLYFSLPQHRPSDLPAHSLTKHKLEIFQRKKT